MTDYGSNITPISRRTENAPIAAVVGVGIVVYAILSTVSFLVGNNLVSIVLLIPSTIVVCVAIVSVLGKFGSGFLTALVERRRAPEFRMLAATASILLLFAAALIASAIPSQFTIPFVFSGGFLAVAYAMPASGDKKEDEFSAKDEFISSMMSSGTRIPIVGKKKKRNRNVEEEEYPYDDENEE